jgi:Beta propeller domain
MAWDNIPRNRFAQARAKERFMKSTRLPATVGAVLRPGYAAAPPAARVRARFRAPVYAPVCAVVCALLLAACGGGSSSSPPEGEASRSLSASNPGDLTQYLQTKLRAREAQRASGTPVYGVVNGTDVFLQPGTGAVGAAPPAAAGAPARSGTTVVEAGVDEPDLLQSDGTHLYTLLPDGKAQRLRVYSRAADGSPVLAKALDLPAEGDNGATVEGMVLSDDNKTLAVLSQRWQPFSIDPLCGPTCMPIAVPSAVPFAPNWLRNSVQVQRVDVSTPASATAGERIQIDGRLLDSRRIGDKLYVVTTHVPSLPVDLLPVSASASEREAVIGKLQASDVLPKLRRNGAAATPLLSETDCWVQPANGSLAIEITTITIFDLRASNLAPTSRCFVGGTEALAMSTSSLYLATTRYNITAGAAASAPIRYPNQITTSVHKFKLTAGGLTYRATGEVPGHLGWNPQLKAFRLSEAGEDLRVLTFTGSMGWGLVEDTSTAPSPARLTVLRERTSDSSLQEVASLPNPQRPALLGKPGEQVMGVRFVGDRGYLVTFRRTDPLYVLDLSNASDPKLAGALEVPGFSDQLFPLANGLLLGVGKDADSNGRTAGVKVALFDVADANNPRLAGSVVVGDPGSHTALDASRHGINLLDKNGSNRIALPANLYDGKLGAPVPWTRGLLRFEVDTAARSLRQLTTLGSSVLTGNEPLWLERSLQIGDTVYFANGLGLQSYGW